MLIISMSRGRASGQPGFDHQCGRGSRVCHSLALIPGAGPGPGVAAESGLRLQALPQRIMRSRSSWAEPAMSLSLCHHDSGTLSHGHEPVCRRWVQRADEKFKTVLTTPALSQGAHTTWTGHPRGEVGERLPASRKLRSVGLGSRRRATEQTLPEQRKTSRLENHAAGSAAWCCCRHCQYSNYSTNHTRSRRIIIIMPRMRVKIVYSLYSLASILKSSTENCLIGFSSIEQRRTVCSKKPLSLTAIYGLQTFSTPNKYAQHRREFCFNLTNNFMMSVLYRLT